MKAVNDDIFELATGHWHAKIAVGIGANLFSLQHLASKIELMRVPESIEALRDFPQGYGIPVLFPPNRISNGRFSWRDREYVFPLNEEERSNHLHGIILGHAWQVQESGDDFVRLVYNYEADETFPHDFSLVMTYRFADDAVEQEFSIVNHSLEPMPFGLGFHTAFWMPADATATITASDGYWEIIEPRALPSCKLLPWESEELVFTDHEKVGGHCPITTDVIDGRPFRGAIIDYPSHGVRLYYEVDSNYHHWCLWNDEGGHEFICLEPQTCMVDAPNLDLPLETTGFQEIAPGDIWTAKTWLRVNDLKS